MHVVLRVDGVVVLCSGDLILCGAVMVEGVEGAVLLKRMSVQINPLLMLLILIGPHSFMFLLFLSSVSYSCLFHDKLN